MNFQGKWTRGATKRTNPFVCPFCGQAPEISTYIEADKTFYSIECENGDECLICPSTCGYETEQEAIKAWNERHDRPDFGEHDDPCNGCVHWPWANGPLNKEMHTNWCKNCRRDCWSTRSDFYQTLNYPLLLRHDELFRRVLNEGYIVCNREDAEIWSNMKYDGEEIHIFARKKRNC